jgi:hypothetical protein
VKPSGIELRLNPRQFFKIFLKGALYMKRNFMLAAVLTLFVMAVSVSAQKGASFSGTWTLDISKSKLGERVMIESQTLTVVQTDKDVKISTATKRAAPPEGAPGGGGAGWNGRKHR